jgi:hypothetical protein
MLDALAQLSRRRSVYVVAAILTTLAVVAPSLGSGGDGEVEATAPSEPDFVGQLTTTTTTVPMSTTSTTAAASTTTSPPADTTTTTAATTPSTTTIAPSTTSTTSDVPEVERSGDEPNPGALYRDRRDQRPKDRERSVGLDTEPARFSGFSIWAAEAREVDTDPVGAPSAWLVVTLRIINRDDTSQSLDETMFLLERPDGTQVRATYVTPWLRDDGEIIANGELFAELWFPAPPEGWSFLSFRPDADSDRGIWGVENAPDDTPDAAEGESASG